MKKSYLLLLLSFVFINVIKSQTPDSSFGINGLAVTPANIDFFDRNSSSSALTPDGKIITVDRTYANSTIDVAVYKTNADGTPDNSFGSGGTLILNPLGQNEFAYATTVQPDGKILIGGFTNNTIGLVIRLNSNGSYDNNFDGDGIVTINFDGATNISTIALQIDNKVIIGGVNFGNFFVGRLNTDGSFDNSFNGSGYNIFDVSGFYDNITSCFIQSDGKIDVAGYTYNGHFHFGIARLNLDGSFDNSFDNDGIKLLSLNAANASVIAQPDNKIILTGSTDEDVSDFITVRLNNDGSYDNSFNGNGIVITDFAGGNDVARDVVLKPDGKIIVAGRAYYAGYDNDFAFAQLNPDGSLDNEFGDAGKYHIDFANSYDEVFSAFLLNNDKLLACGFTYMNNTSNIGMVRLNLSPLITFYRDADEDGFGDAANSLQASLQPDGYITDSSDCNDADADVHSPQIYYADYDHDGFGDVHTMLSICSSAPPENYVTDSTDCNDGDHSIYPGGTEYCDGKDNDCDGQIDEDAPAKPVITANGSTTNVCPGKTIMLISSTAASYVWSTGATTQNIVVSSAGLYTVTIADEKNCQNTSNAVVVTYQGCAAPTGLATTNLKATSAKLNWNAVSCAVGYQLQYRKKNASAWIASRLTATSKNITGLSPSTQYQWRVLTGCQVNPNIVSPYSSIQVFTTKAPALNIEISNTKLSEEFKASVYPNPAYSNATIVFTTGKAGNYVVELRDVLGRLLLVKKGEAVAGQNKITLEVNKYAQGVYIVNLETGTEKMTLKFNKE